MALPVIQGRVRREVLLRYVGGTSDKEYRITVSQDAGGNAYCYSAHGPTGNIHTGRLETPAKCSLWAAERKADELISKKQNHSKTPYTVISDQFPSDPATASAPPPAAPSPKPLPARVKATGQRPSSMASMAVFNNLF